MFNEWEQLGIILVAASAMMAVLWLLQRKIHDAGLVDVGWSAGLGFAAIFCALTGEGDAYRRLAIGLIGGLWGLRLGYHLLIDRVITAEEEDGRYQSLREHFGDRFQRFIFWFFQAQAVSIPILAVPFVLAAGSDAPLDWVAHAGLALFVLAKAMEGVADWQLRQFKKDKSNKGKVCTVGLWRYSRHPNYFFEWLIWVAFALVALAHPIGWLGFLSAAIIFTLITRVTGIPPTEKRATKSRPVKYPRYQKAVSAFVPWPPKPSIEHVNDPDEPAEPAT